MANFKKAKAYLMIFCNFIWVTAFANPTGGVVSGGSATITSPNSTTVQVNQTSNKAIIDWQTFNIQQGETTHFVQPSASSISLNRVNAMNGASSIFGNLTANGQVWLINPAGIVFGPSAQVNVGGLLATTSNITNEDFLSGNYRFTPDSRFTNRSVINHGTITVQQGGLAGLVGDGVKNTGVIQARLGTVLLGGAQAYTLDFDGDQLINFVIQKGPSGKAVDENNHPLDAAVTNTGVASVRSGLVSTADAKSIVENSINMAGLQAANQVSMRGGRIILSAGNGNVKVSGKLHAPRGSISVKGYDVAVNNAKLSTSSRLASAGQISIVADHTLQINSSTITANSTINKGGEIRLLSPNYVGIRSSSIAANGELGGGVVLVGGNWQGKGPEINSQLTYFDPDSSISADAITNGNGGKIVVWADDSTYAHGSISARGGLLGGNGGEIETSGHRYLSVSGISINTYAPVGAAGKWLLDPADIVIVNNLSPNYINGGSFSGGIFTPNPGATSSLIGTDTITSKLNAGTDVTITTTSSGGAPGTITINYDSNFASNQFTWTTANTLTLLADSNITIYAPITATNGGLVLTPGSSGQVYLAGNISTGSLIVNKPLNFQGTASITTVGSQTYNDSVILPGGFDRTITGGDIAFNSGITLGSGLTINTTGSTSNVVGAITGAGALRLNVNASYTGKLILSSSNSYTGQTTVYHGTLSIENTGGLGSTSAISVQSGGTLDMNFSTSGTLTNGNVITLNGSGVGSAGALTSSGVGTTTLNNLITLGSNSTIGGAGNLILANPISNSSNYTLTKAGAGTLTLAGSLSSHSGATTINGGILSISVLTALGNTAPNTKMGLLTIDGGGTLLYTGTGASVGIQTYGNLTDAGYDFNRDVTIGSGGGTIKLTSADLVNAFFLGDKLTLNGTLTVDINTQTNPNATAAFGQPDNFRISTKNSIDLPSGIGGITLTGGGALVLDSAASYTYTGATNIEAGKLVVWRAGLGNPTAVTVRSGASLILNDNPTVQVTGLNTTIGSLTLYSDTTQGASVITNTAQLTLGGNVTLLTNGTGANAATISGNLNLGGATRIFDIARGSALPASDLTISGVVSNGGVTKSGLGTLILSGNNTYSGATTVNAGTLSIINKSGLGSTSGTTVSSGGTLDINFDDVLANTNTITLNGSGVNSAGALTGTGLAVLNNPISLASSTVIGITGVLTLSGVVSGANSLTKSGAGKLLLNAINTYSGATVVNEGTLTITHLDGLGSTSSTTVASGATLGMSITGSLANTNTITLNGNGVSSLGALTSAGAAILSNPIVLASDTIIAGAGSLTLNGIVSGAGSLTKIESGTLTLNNNSNSYTGFTKITGGTLSIASDGALGVITPAVFVENQLQLDGGILETTGTFAFNVNRGITLTANSSIENTGEVTLSKTNGNFDLVLSSTGAGSFTVSQPIGSITPLASLSVTGPLTLSGSNDAAGGDIRTSGAQNYNGAVTLTPGADRVLLGGNITFNSSSPLVLGSGISFYTTTGSNSSVASVISGAGALYLNTSLVGPRYSTAGYTGNLTLSGTNTYTGATVVNTGVLSINNTDALGSSSGTSIASGATLNMNFTGTLANTNTITLNGNGAGLSGALTMGGSSVVMSNPIVLDSNSTLFVSLGKTLTLNGAINGGYALALTGQGAINLGGIVGGSTPLASLTTDISTILGLNTTSVTTNGAQNYAGSVSRTGAITFNAGAGSITLDNASNAFSGGAVSFNNTGANNVSLTNNGSLILGASNVGSGTLTINSGAITQTGAITQAASAGGASFSAGANAITLTNASNSFTGAVSLNNSGANAVQLTNAGALNLGTVAVGGALTLTSAGAMTQSSSIVATGGVTTLASGSANNITLLNSSNDFSSLAVVSGNNVLIKDANTLNLGASTVTGSLTLNVTGGLVFTGSTSVGGSLNVTTNSGNITQTNPLTVTGASTFNAGAGLVTLTNAGNLFTGAVTLTNTGNNNVSLTNNRATIIAISNVGSGALAINSSGAITQTGAITQAASAGDASFSAGANAITLTNASNSFTGAVSLSNSGVNNVSLTNNRALSLAASSVGTGTLTISSNGAGAITQTGAITQAASAGDVSFSAGTNAITLTNASNSFTGAVSLNNSGGNNVSLTNNRALSLGASSVGTGTLTISSNGAGAITQTGAITQAASAGGASFSAGANAITLTNASNSFTGAVSLNNSGANAVQLTNTGALNLGTVAVGGALTLTSAGAMTQSGSIVATGGVTTLASGSANNITLLNSSNDFGSLAVVSGNNVLIKDANTLNLGASTVTGSLVLNVTGGLAFTGSTSVGGSLNVTTNSGNITQTNPLTVTGVSTFNAGAGLVTLTNAGNLFTGAIALNNSGNNDISVTNNKALIIGTSSVGSGALTISSNGAGAITQIGTITQAAGAGIATFSAGANAITLTNASNSFTGAVSLNNSGANDAVINNNPALSLGASNVGRKLTATSGAGIALQGVLTANNTGGSAGADSIVLSGTSFNNTAGASALNPGTGRFLVWSSNPASDTRGGLAYNFKQYNATYDSTTVLGSGNGFLYSINPTITTSLTGTVSKTYDATTTATLTAGNYAAPTGAIDGDTVTLNTPTNGTYDNKNVGTGKTVTATGLSITSATNNSATVYGYALGSAIATGNIGEITAATLNYVANSASSIYGDAIPALSGSVSGFVGSDTLANATTGSLAFNTSASNTSNVGSYDITGSGLTANNGNYVFTQAAGNATALTITQRALNINGTRVYDGTTSFSAGELSAGNVVNGDTVTLSGSAAVGSKNVGNYTSFTSNSLTSSNNNYKVTGGSISTDITPATLSLSGLSANNKVYDATTAATTAGTAVYAGLITGDTVSIVSKVFADKNVGNNKAVILGLGGADAGNYNFTQPGLVANITPASLTSLGIAANSKIFDANTVATLNLGSASLNGVFSGDSVGLDSSGYTANFILAAIGTNIPVTVANLALTGSAAGNYTLTQPNYVTGNILAVPVPPAPSPTPSVNPTALVDNLVAAANSGLLPVAAFGQLVHPDLMFVTITQPIGANSTPINIDVNNQIVSKPMDVSFGSLDNTLRISYGSEQSVNNQLTINQSLEFNRFRDDLNLGLSNDLFVSVNGVAGRHVTIDSSINGVGRSDSFGSGWLRIDGGQALTYRTTTKPTFTADLININTISIDGNSTLDGSGMTLNVMPEIMPWPLGLLVSSNSLDDHS